LGIRLLRMTVRVIKKRPEPTKRKTVLLIKVESGNEFLHMLLVCIRSYLKSIMRYKFLILDTYHPDTQYLRGQGCEDPWLFFEGERSPRAIRLGSTALEFCAASFFTVWFH
jgi:hypothetical protein